MFLCFQPQGFSLFVQQLHLPLQLPLQVFHPPRPVSTSSGPTISQPFWATRRPAFLWHSRGVAACLVVRKWANVWLQRRETVDGNWFTVWVWRSKEMIVERSHIILCIYCLMKMHISVLGVIINIISVACLHKEKLLDPSNNWYCWNITSHLVIHLIGFRYAVVDVMFCPSRNRFFKDYLLAAVCEVALWTRPRNSWTTEKNICPFNTNCCFPFCFCMDYLNEILRVNWWALEVLVGGFSYF